MKLKVNDILALGVFLTLLIPAVINHSGIIQKITVFGVEPVLESDSVSWWDGSKQKQFESNLMKESIARTYFIRLRNQYQYSLFNKINAQDIYEYNGLHFRFYSYTFNEEQNFVGEETVKKKVEDLSILRDLIGDSIPIITVITPYKAHYYADKLPEKHKTNSKETNYHYYKKALLQHDFPVLDFDDYFLKNRSVTPAIFGNGGIHWSHYAMAVAMDSIVNYVSDANHINYDSFHFDTVIPPKINVDDLDIALMRNLLKKPKDENLRDIVVTPIEGEKRMKAVIVSDSYCFSILSSGVAKNIFTKDTDFLYYFNSIYNGQLVNGVIDIEKVKADLKDADCVIIISDIVNLEKFGYGFIERMNVELQRNK